MVGLLVIFGVHGEDKGQFPVLEPIKAPVFFLQKVEVGYFQPFRIIPQISTAGDDLEVEEGFHAWCLEGFGMDPVQGLLRNLLSFAVIVLAHGYKGNDLQIITLKVEGGVVPGFFLKGLDKCFGLFQGRIAGSFGMRKICGKEEVAPLGL
jgi:hypothetical protein